MNSDVENTSSSSDGPPNTPPASDSGDEISHLPDATQHMPANEVGGDTVNVVTVKKTIAPKAKALQVLVKGPLRPWEYAEVKETIAVKKVFRELNLSGDNISYQVEFEDGRKEDASHDTLLKLRNGPEALDTYNDQDEKVDHSLSLRLSRGLRSSNHSRMSSAAGKRTRSSTTRAKDQNFIDITTAISSSDDDDGNPDKQKVGKRRRVGKHLRDGLRSGRSISIAASDTDSSSEEEMEDKFLPTRSGNLKRGIKPSRGGDTKIRRSARSYSGQKGLNYHEYQLDDPSTDAVDDVDELAVDVKASSGETLLSDIKSQKNIRRDIGSGRGRGRRKKDGPVRGGMMRGKAVFGRIDPSSSSSDEVPERTRRSGRTTKTNKNMKERLEDEEIFAETDADEKTTKVISIREVFKALPNKSRFRLMHNDRCDVCNGLGTASNKGPSPLVYCQGCSTSIHKICLGYRSSREHMVTKVEEEDFVMQCRRCIGLATKKDPMAPRLDVCQECQKSGAACAAFSLKRTSKQEEKLRNENDGTDPITVVDPNLINNDKIILFRCIDCRRGFHFEHLPPLGSNYNSAANNSADDHYREYLSNWQCKECTDNEERVQGLVAWRPADTENYVPGQTYEVVKEDNKEYLIKWEGLSHFRCTWMPGAWVWGITTTAMRNAFSRRENDVASLPKMTEVDAIPEEYLRMEIVMGVRYSNRVSTHTEEIDKARVNEVEEVFVKFQGLGYDQVVWERPPDPSETDRWKDFVSAYSEYLAGKYFKQPPPKLKERVQGYRNLNFEKNLVLTRQPASLTGGEMMDYQMEGLNWLLYNFHQAKNVILADEMGLGKTIQVIAAIVALVKDRPKCWPFLVVVPNSTCPNWRREIKQWAPSLRVVAYYGSREARDMAMKYELYPDGCSDLRAHIVVTSFDAPVDDHSRPFFKRIKWTGMIVDEGQRLKNDKNLLYGALSDLKVPFRVLMTGTPLQNNKRELFNLLQFLDDTVNAEKLDEEYAELTKKNLPKLHGLIRPYFLRRTKLQVLKFLPPVAQVIVPVTMSVVQKKLYKSILSKSPELIQAIMIKNQAALNPKDRGSLNNMLMQLRKCLCHPFVYSEAIEERSASRTVLHRNLVDASSKLQLLEIMLPKLQERGHRVLIFSQFLKQLDIIEDFLDGLGLAFQRLDGNIGTLEKQKRIDEFNAPDSTLFAFLLSTRAGGVGINLATADTVIIMDPDFNPHQDIQALSRAHRIGQKKKVLVFQLMTKDSAEEKIVQIGRKKMALDHALIESMSSNEDAGVDLQSILQHGAQALFNDNDENDIKYDSVSIDKLLDRSQVENTSAGDDKSAESQFSYARIWANNTETLTDSIDDADDQEELPSATVWEKILKQREDDAAAEAAAQERLLGRGKRQRQAVNYRGSHIGLDDEALNLSPEHKRNMPTSTRNSDVDTDFAMAAESGEEDFEPDTINVDSGQTQVHQNRKGGQTRNPHSKSSNRQVDGFRRAKLVGNIPNPTPNNQTYVNPNPETFGSNNNPSNRGEAVQARYCYACGQSHYPGYCPLRKIGVEHCGLCGIAHFGISRTCPHLSSETQVRLMIDALRTSTEPRENIERARVYLRGVIGDIVRRKKQKREKQSRLQEQNVSEITGAQLPPQLLHISHSLSQTNLPLPVSGLSQSPRQDGHIPGH